ncbi:hypothetical protein K440DRAFT_618767 [Wilcoxina mikolae CBS 423.85]|nr:hypothetical protein K440DRAFT_618767 [Wilcoxina mikolae CBS 423.85]
MFQQAPSRRQASITCAKNRAADITSLFSSLQNSVPAGILPLNTRRMRANMRGYSISTSSSATSSAASTPGGNGETSTGSTQSSTGQMYTNWVFVTSAEVLARAGEGEDDDDGGGGRGGEGYHDHTEGGGGGCEGDGGGTVREVSTGTAVGGGWTKRQYREECEKLRGKEWVFR